MGIKAVMRLDTISWKPAIIFCCACITWIVISFIIGVTGPSRLDREVSYAYQCPGNSHTWNSNCTGSQMAIGQPSPWITIKTGQIDRTWHMIFWLFEKKLEGIEGPLTTYTHVQGKSSLRPGDSWTTVIANMTHHSNFFCLGFRLECSKSLLIWVNDPRFDTFRAQVTFGKVADLGRYIGDVGFETITTPDSYTKISLGFKHTYGIVSILITLFWIIYLIFVKRWPYSAWTWEQRSLTFLLFGLVIYNNPLYGLQFWTTDTFLPFWNAFCEILFIGLALAIWLTQIGRFKRAVKYENYLKWRSQQRDQIVAPSEPETYLPENATDNGETDRQNSEQENPENSNQQPNLPSNTTYGTREETEDDIFYRQQQAIDAIKYAFPVEPVNDDDPVFQSHSLPIIVIVLLYVVLAATLFIWSSKRDRMTPIMGMAESGAGFQLLYYLTAAFYTVLVILLTVQLSFNALGTRDHKDILWGRYIFFAGPTVFLSLSLVLGMFTTNIGPFASNMVGILCYGALFNCYVYYMMWAYWPVEGGWASKESAETRSLFQTASYPSSL